MNRPRCFVDGFGNYGGLIAQFDSGGSGCIQDAANDGVSGRSPHDDGDERGSAQDGGRSTEKVGYGGGRVQIDGFGIWRHHDGKGINREGGGDLVIAYTAADVAKENSKFGEKNETTAKVLAPEAPATAEQSTTTATTSKSTPMSPLIDNETSADH